MGGYFDTLKVIVLIAFRNLFASRLKTLIVGGIILFGSTLVVVGTALVDSVDTAMSRSIIGSVAGHIQVYNAKSADELTVMGDVLMDDADLAQIDDFKAMRDAIMSVPNVKDVVPMGLSGAMVPAGNTVDVMLEKLRDLVRRKQAGEDVGAAIESQKDHVRQIGSVLADDLANLGKILNEKAVSTDEREAIRLVSAPGFWNKFDKDPLGTLEFLENRIAPLASDAEFLFLRYVGTDLAAFSRSFDRMKIVDGTTIPPGKRGFLFSKWIYEQQVKMKTAHRLDQIRDAIVKRGKTIATDPDLQHQIKQNTAEVKEILLQLDGQQMAMFREKLQKELGSKENDVSKLLAEFLRVDDSTIMRRYRLFYDELAPSLTLYRVRVGDMLTVRALTRGGYVQSVNLRVYGTYAFEGLEDSHTAGELNIMDMVSFRELYGFSTPERDKEIQAIKASAGLKAIDRDKVEAELFDTGSQDNSDNSAAAEKPTIVENADTRRHRPHANRHHHAEKPTIVENADAALRSLSGRAKLVKRERESYDPAQLRQGVVLNGAVIVKDPQQIRQTMADIEAAGRKAGLPLKTIDWQKASGLVGQFVTMTRAVLYISVLIIFAIALVIISNALVMATLERMAEIGTLRAVGAQRRFLLGMLFVEALAVGGLFGGIGAALGAGIVAVLHVVGIPAFNDIFHFFFSGPRLHPGLSVTNVAFALAIVLVVSAVSCVYPGILAMRVSPRQAMQSDE